MTHTRFENFDEKTQDTIDKALSTVNNIWHTWFPSSTTTTTTTGGTGTGGTATPKPYTPPPPPDKPKYRGLIYGGIALGLLGVGFLIYKKTKKS